MWNDCIMMISFYGYDSTVHVALPSCSIYFAKFSPHWMALVNSEALIGSKFRPTYQSHGPRTFPFQRKQQTANQQSKGARESI